MSVYFTPLTITGPESRRAQLSISNGESEASAVALSGIAFQNLGISHNKLDFDDQTVNGMSPARSIVVTNYSNAVVSSLVIAVAGDFTESHPRCEKIAPGASCAISVVFVPKLAGDNAGSLTISTDQSAIGILPRVVLLGGHGIVRCRVTPFSVGNWNIWLPIFIGGLYLAGLILVRWHMIAKPARSQTVAAINAVRSQLIAETVGLPANPSREGRVDRIKYLLDIAVYPFKHKNFPLQKDQNGNEMSLVPGYFPWYTRFYNALFWPRGQELAGWSLAHEAELELLALLNIDKIRARMEMAEQQLRVMNDPVALALADHLHDETGSPASMSLDRSQALLVEALGRIYAQADTAYFRLTSWHSKMIWQVGCALLFIFALAVTLDNAILLLLGAVGGLLSRLTRSAHAAEGANDHGASWGALFLSPLSGALSAWGGILLIVLGMKVNILGSAINVDWCNPYDPGTLAIALLFGFSERLFDGVATQLEGKLVKTPPSVPPTDPVTSQQTDGKVPKAPTSSQAANIVSPKITSIVPSDQPVLGKPVSLSVKGDNFKPDAAATITDARGNPRSARVEFKDSNNLVVNATPLGDKAFTSTLTITNPDKQSASLKFEVALA